MVPLTWKTWVASSVMVPAVMFAPGPHSMVAVKSEGTALGSVDMNVGTSWVVSTPWTAAIYRPPKFSMLLGKSAGSAMVAELAAMAVLPPAVLMIVVTTGELLVVA